MTDKIKNVLIGFFMLMSLMIIVGTILFLKPSIGDGKKTLNVRFSNMAGIHKGTRVTFAGNPIGEVEQITKVQDARTQIKDELGRIYFYQLKLKVDSSVEIYDCDIISIQTTGLMGEKSVGINPKASLKKPVKIVTNDILYAKSVDPFENTADQISQLSDKAEKAIDNFNSWFEKNSNNISTSISSISTLFETAKDNGSFDKLSMIIDNLALTSRFLSTDGKETLQNLNALTKHLNKTGGSVGKLINSDDLYMNLNAIISKANTLFNDLNNYGLLFQYSKRWQRLRTQRATILQALSDPKDFKSFFEKEVADITASLSRINQLVSKAKDSGQKHKILSSDSYRKNFGYLLRQIESLNDMIKLYNEHLLDQSNAQ